MKNTEKNYMDLWVYVPELGQLLCISEGTGDNLLKEDVANGYVDYIYYEQYDAADPELTEIDGGQVLLTTLFREKYENTAQCIPEVLDMAYGTTEMCYHVGSSAEELQVLQTMYTVFENNMADGSKKQVYLMCEDEFVTLLKSRISEITECRDALSIVESFEQVAYPENHYLCDSGWIESTITSTDETLYVEVFYHSAIFDDRDETFHIATVTTRCNDEAAHMRMGLLSGAIVACGNDILHQNAWRLVSYDMIERVQTLQNYGISYQNVVDVIKDENRTTLEEIKKFASDAHLPDRTRHLANLRLVADTMFGQTYLYQIANMWHLVDPVCKLGGYKEATPVFPAFLIKDCFASFGDTLEIKACN